MQDRVVRFVAKHSRISEEKFRELMFRTGELARDIGTVLVGKDAVEVGLIDEVGGIGNAVHKLQELIEEKKKQKKEKEETEEKQIKEQDAEQLKVKHPTQNKEPSK